MECCKGLNSTSMPRLQGGHVTSEASSDFAANYFPGAAKFRSYACLMFRIECEDNYMMLDVEDHCTLDLSNGFYRVQLNWCLWFRSNCISNLGLYASVERKYCDKYNETRKGPVSGTELYQQIACIEFEICQNSQASIDDHKMVCVFDMWTETFLWLKNRCFLMESVCIKQALYLDMIRLNPCPLLLHDDKFRRLRSTKNLMREGDFSSCNAKYECHLEKNINFICAEDLLNEKNIIKLRNSDHLLNYNCIANGKELMVILPGTACESQKYYTIFSKPIEEHLFKKYGKHAFVTYELENWKTCSKKSFVVKKICSINFETSSLPITKTNECLFYKYDCGKNEVHLRLGDGDCRPSDLLQLVSNESYKDGYGTS